jgi:hypothetical protein
VADQQRIQIDELAHHPKKIFLTKLIFS